MAVETRKRLGALDEMEASQQRVYVLTSEIATLQRKIAEHGEVIRHDKVCTCRGRDQDEIKTRSICLLVY